MIWEFAVPGTPISLNSKSKAKPRWTEKVRQSGIIGLDSTLFPVLGDVAVTVVFFHDSSSLDVDNMLKPVLDGIYPEILVDDGQVQEVLGARRDISNGIIIRNPPPLIIPLLASQEPFVYVGVGAALDQEDLPWLTKI